MSAVDREPAAYLTLAEVKLPPHRNNKSGKLVVKHTFLELETRSASTDSANEGGVKARASSDPGFLEKHEDSSDWEENDKAARAVDAQEKLVLNGFSDIEDEDFESEDEESTAVPSRSPMTSREGVSSFGSRSGVSSFSSTAVTRIPEDEQVQPSMSATKASAQDARRAPTSPEDLERLANENSRLAAENALLREKCLEVARAAQTAAAATASVAAYWPDVDESADLPTDTPAKTSRALPPGALPPGALPPGALSSSTATSLGVQPRKGSSMPSQDAACYSSLIPGGALPAGLLTGKTAVKPGKVAGGQMSQVQEANGQSSLSSSRIKGRRRRGGADGVSNPDALEWIESPVCTVPIEERTTVMLRNIPNNYSRQMLLDLIDSEGFTCQYDFIYLPVDFKSRASLGYAFVNLTSPPVAQRFWKTFNGFSNWILPSRKVCGLNWSGPHQGLDAHLERYRNSPVMHEGVPDAFKPVVFQDGVRIAFPPPTKRLREPRTRHYHTGSILACVPTGSTPAGPPSTTAGCSSFTNDPQVKADAAEPMRGFDHPDNFTHRSVKIKKQTKDAECQVHEPSLWPVHEDLDFAEVSGDEQWWF